MAIAAGLIGTPEDEVRRYVLSAAPERAPSHPAPDWTGVDADSSLESSSIMSRSRIGISRCSTRITDELIRSSMSRSMERASSSGITQPRRALRITNCSCILARR